MVPVTLLHISLHNDSKWQARGLSSQFAIADQVYLCTRILSRMSSDDSLTAPSAIISRSMSQCL
jgi:hypothetical protein